MMVSIVAVVAMALLVFAVEPIARRLGLPHLQPWGARPSDSSSPAV
jgi:hypothetical protein